MAESRKIVRAFLGSPGDLGDERRAAKAVVDEINDTVANRLGYHVELVRWENVVASFGRPQGTINKELERCELFVGMLWKKWGTPPSKGGPYTSGFHEEYSISAESCVKTGRPEISIYFKDVEPAQLEDPGPELRKVLEFKRGIVEEKTGIYESFANVGELSLKLRRCLTQYLFTLRDEEQKSISEESQTLPAERDGRGALPAAATTDNTPLSREGSVFLRGFIARTETGGGSTISATEVARVRLLGGMLGRPGNDERSLGVHDANLLFLERDRVAWGRTELDGLVDAGCEHFASENAPLWCWLSKLDGFDRNLLPLFSFVGAADRVVGVLRAMRLLAEPLNVDATLTRQAYLDQWLTGDATSPVRAAALEYLGECGQPSDLAAIRAEQDRKNYQTSGSAIEAMLRIELRQSRAHALKLLYELQEESVPAEVVEEMFSNDTSIQDETLIEGLAHKSADVRRIAVGLLVRRDELSIEIAESLLADADPTVRLEALAALTKAGKAYSLEQARAVLVKPKPAASLFGGVGSSDRAGEKSFALFKKRWYGALSETQLESASAAGLILDPDAYFASKERQFSKSGQELREAIGDNYKVAFDKAVDKLASYFGEGGAESVVRVRRLGEAYRKNITRDALSVLCRKGDATDLELIRTTLQAGTVDPADADVVYLSKYGEWSDIPLIVAAAQRTDGTTASLLNPADPVKYKAAAQAIYRIGHKRLAEVVTLDMPTALLSRVVRAAAANVFKALPNSLLQELLRSTSADVRKSTALKCIRHLPRRRLSELLEKHISNDQPRYYNVVHWLDFGISVPRDRMLIAASAVIKRLG